MSEVLTIDINRPKIHPNNARRSDVPMIMRSLERFGQVKPIVVQRSTGNVVAGNHVLEAARKLGWSTIKVIVEDMDDETALGYLIADNRTSDKSSYSKDDLFALLTQASDLQGLGFTDDDVEEMASDLEEPGVPRQSAPNGDALVDADKERYDPMREILIMVPVSEMERFTSQIAALQKHWGTRTTVETIKRVIGIAHDALPKPEEGFQRQAATGF